MSQARNIDNHAIVIGASIAGLLSARVLADYFTSVTIVDSDSLPTQANPRKGVPQSLQPHILFARGYRILEELFPGIGTEFRIAGAVPIDWAQEFYHFSHQGWSANAQSPSAVVSFTCSRPLLELIIRQRLLNLSNVYFVEEYRVSGLLCNSSNTHVNGVVVHSTTGALENSLPASLVVDASGRRSQAPKWLQNIGFTPPSETIINPFLGYATRRYKQPKDFNFGWKVMLISQSAPNMTRLGYLAEIEGGQWIATLGGYGHDYPSTDEEAFLAFASSLPSSKFYETIKDAKPTSEIYAYRATSNRLRHYEKVALPEGFVCLGDSVCALCPVYGQGMTVSALSVILLRDWLNKSYNPVSAWHLSSTNFQQQLAKNNVFHWTVATSQDLQFSTTKGGTNRSGLISVILKWYTQRLIHLANSDSEIYTFLLEVAHLLKSPLHLYHPKVLFRILTEA